MPLPFDHRVRPLGGASHMPCASGVDAHGQKRQLDDEKIGMRTG